jgi:hypothetical protein
MIEIEQLAALFHIHKEASAHGSNFVNIKDAAWRELQKYDAEHKDHNEEQKKKDAEEAAEAAKLKHEEREAITKENEAAIVQPRAEPEPVVEPEPVIERRDI